MFICKVDSDGVLATSPPYRRQKKLCDIGLNVSSYVSTIGKGLGYSRALPYPTLWT